MQRGTLGKDTPTSSNFNDRFDNLNDRLDRNTGRQGFSGRRARDLSPQSDTFNNGDLGGDAFNDGQSDSLQQDQQSFDQGQQSLQREQFDLDDDRFNTTIGNDDGNVPSSDQTRTRSFGSSLRRTDRPIGSNTLRSDAPSSPTDRAMRTAFRARRSALTASGPTASHAIPNG